MPTDRRKRVLGRVAMGIALAAAAGPGLESQTPPSPAPNPCVDELQVISVRVEEKKIQFKRGSSGIVLLGVDEKAFPAWSTLKPGQKLRASCRERAGAGYVILRARVMTDERQP